jgi:hypothetical protein
MIELKETIRNKELAYLENKYKIKALLSEVGYEHILTYMIEDLDRYDILGNEDLWVLRMAESLEDAYNVLIGKYKDEDNIDSKVTPNEN